MLKIDAFHWDESTRKAFLAFKETLKTAPILSLPDFSKQFILEIDASGTGIGAVLLQEEKPIAFYSKKLLDHLVKSSTYVRELHAVIR